MVAISHAARKVEHPLTSSLKFCIRALSHVDSAGRPLSKNTNEFTFHFVSKKELKDIRVPRFCEVYEKGETDTNKVLT